jgi:hypothetical protein
MKRMHIAIVGTRLLLANALSAQNAVKPFHLDQTTISNVQAAYQSYALTATQLMQAYLERMHAANATTWK